MTAEEFAVLAGILVTLFLVSVPVMVILRVMLALLRSSDPPASTDKSPPDVIEGKFKQ